MNTLQLMACHKLFNGEQRRYRHFSACNQCEMTFNVFLPRQALQGYAVPVVYCLAGLTCTDETFAMKSGAQRYASSWGMALVMPDTSPRGKGVADVDADDLGQGAGFYLNATEAPWARHYQMYDYVARELPQLVEAYLPVDDRRSICGHSMGGHGALMLALRQPERYRSASAFAPVAHPTVCGWGTKAFEAYLGNDRANWFVYDSTVLASQATVAPPMLIDQGDADPFYADELYPQDFVRAAQASGLSVQYHERSGYDHGYYFISSFIESHLAFHATALNL